jgi:thiol-disulfide isomerase/thioredoxin
MISSLLALAAGFLLFVGVLFLAERDRDLRKFWVSRVLTATIVALLLWKLTPVWTRFDAVFDNPLILLSMNGGLAAVLGGLFAFCTIVAVSLWQIGKESPETKRWPLGVPVLAALALVGLWTAFEPVVFPRSGPAPVAEVQALVPDLEGRKHALADWKGKVVVLNFWATWCPPCLAELPEFQAFTSKPSDKIALVAVDMIATEKQGTAGVIRFASEHKMNWTLLTDPDAQLQSAFHVTALPTTVVLDTEGRVVDRREGAVDLFWLRGLEGRFAK